MDLALQDIADIKAYLSGFYQGTWSRFSQKLEDSIFALSSTPYIYEAYRTNYDYRRLIVGNYLVFYKVFESEKSVRIYRILHGAKDIQQYLNP
jgi:plasmid stabilization system protein ParE